jgi:hypothetical protein
MSCHRFLLILPMLALLTACNREQPSGVPDVPASAPTQPVAAPPPPPVAATPQAEMSPAPTPPPPLDDDIPPLTQTGFPDCDDYLEIFRQCVNAHFTGEQRAAKARELESAYNSIAGNIARNVDPSRVAGRCRKSRVMTGQRLGDIGCAF